MAVVLLAWELGAGTGHCIKLAPVAQRLAAAGHEIVVAARDLVTAAKFFGRLDVTYYQAPLLVGDPVNPLLWPRSLAQALRNTGFGDDRDLDVLVRAWRSVLAAVRPDVIVCDHSPIALLASRWFDVRRVILATGFELPPAVAPLPDLEYWRDDQSEPAELAAQEQSVLERVNRLLVRDGLRPLARLADLYHDVDLGCLLTWAELDHYPSRSGARYWGAWSPGGGFFAEWPRGSGPRVFGYLQPPRPQWELAGFLSFLRAQPMATLIYVPGGDREWLAQFETHSLRFVHEPVDIRQVARECDAAILNGNAGSVGELLLHGVPLLNIPLHLEQLITAHRVADLGAGRMADARRPQQMAEELMALLATPSHRTAAEAFARKYADFDPEQAIDEVAGEICRLV